jgi:hypothetical protein
MGIRITSLFFLLIFTLVSCKKDPDPVKEDPPPPKIRADFSFEKDCNLLLVNDTTQFLDSITLFKNFSDTGLQVTYKWDFGDNQISTEKNPAHAYSKPGVYPVTLYTYYNQQPSDTFSRNLLIIIGQREFKGSLAYATGIDFDEAPDKGILALVVEEASWGSPSYSILSVDSLLRKKFLKPLPGSSIRLKSLKRINATEYILSGNYQMGNTNQFALSKINANGDLLWEKYISNLAGENTYTLPTANGSLITIGNSSSTVNPYTIVVKCDANGNELWRKQFDGVQIPTLIRSANNIIEIPTGYAFAALQPTVNYSVIVLTKLDFNGNVTGQATAAPGNIGTISEAGVAYTNNTFMVYATRTQNIFMFTSAPSFINSRQLYGSGISHGIAANGKFYINEGTFQYASYKQLSDAGVEEWSIPFGNAIRLSCFSVHFGATRYGRKVLYTSYNEVIGMADGQNNPDYFNGSSVYLVKAYNNGKIK